MASLGISTGFAGAISQDWFGDALFVASQAAGLDLRFLQQVAQPPLLAIVYETAPPQYNFIGETALTSPLIQLYCQRNRRILARLV